MMQKYEKVAVIFDFFYFLPQKISTFAPFFITNSSFPPPFNSYTYWLSHLVMFTYTVFYDASLYDFL